MKRIHSRAVAQLTIISLAALLATTHSSSAQVPNAEHVVLIGIDGLCPAGIRTVDPPNFKALVSEGASTMHARSVMPTSSSPNWASMIMGAGPEQHGITSNDWQRNKFEITPTDKGPEGIFPTIYGVLRAQRPNSIIGVFHDWNDYGRLVERNSCDTVEDADGPDDATQRGIGFIRERKPTFTFVHLDHVDHAGHQHGWLSPEYLQAVGHADELIGQMRRAITDAGIADKTVVLVTADHGGIKKGHGGNTMDELEIPWNIVGPGVRKGHEIKAPVNQYDTAATLAHIFGVKPPQSWIAKPVLDAFDDPAPKSAK